MYCYLSSINTPPIHFLFVFIVVLFFVYVLFLSIIIISFIVIILVFLPTDYLICYCIIIIM